MKEKPWSGLGAQKCVGVVEVEAVDCCREAERPVCGLDRVEKSSKVPVCSG